MPPAVLARGDLTDDTSASSGLTETVRDRVVRVDRTADKKPLGTLGAGPVLAAVSGVAVGLALSPPVLDAVSGCCLSPARLRTGLSSGLTSFEDAVAAELALDAVGGRAAERRRRRLRPGPGMPDLAGETDADADAGVEEMEVLVPDPEPEAWCRGLCLSVDPVLLLIGRVGADGLRVWTGLLEEDVAVVVGVLAWAVMAGGRREVLDVERGRRLWTCGMLRGCEQAARFCLLSPKCLQVLEGWRW